MVLLSPEQMTQPQNKGLSPWELSSAIRHPSLARGKKPPAQPLRLPPADRTPSRGRGKGSLFWGPQLALPTDPSLHRLVQGGGVGCGSPGSSWGWTQT